MLEQIIHQLPFNWPQLFAFTLFAIIVYNLLLYLFNFKRTFSLMETIPGPGVGLNFLIGNLYILDSNKKYDLLTRFFDVLNGMSKVYSESQMYRIWLSYRPFVVIYRSEAAEKIFSSTVHIEKSAEYNFIRPWLSTGLLTSFGKKWFHRRKMLTPAFHFNILEAFLPTMNEHAQVLVDVINRKNALNKAKQADDPGSSSTDTLDIVPLITNCALDVICETAMGIKIDSQNDQNKSYVAAIHRVSGNIVKRVLRPWFWNKWIYRFFSADGRSDAVDLKTLHNFTMKVIEERKKEMLADGDAMSSELVNSAKRRLAFIDILLKQHFQNPDQFTKMDIREEVDTFMFEGHDTTAMSMIWTLYLLAKHPDIQDRVQQEIDEVCADHDHSDTETDTNQHFTTNQLRRMKFLEACIKESLRLMPSVPFIARVAAEDIVLNDQSTIPKGCTLFLFIYSIQRDPKYFDKPDQFIPERFTEGSSGFVRNPFAYVPFSAGPRNCIGQKFALQEEKIILATLLKNFRLDSGLEYDTVTVQPELVLRPKIPIPLRFVPRNDI